MAVYLQCPCKVRGPRRNIYNMVWCVFISCAYSHIAEDTPKEVLKRKFEFKVILSISVVFLFPHPPHAISCPYKMTGFLPSTYKMGWRCGSFFSLKHATQDFRLFKAAWVLDAHHVVPFKKTPTHTHREQHDHLSHVLNPCVHVKQGAHCKGLA